MLFQSTIRKELARNFTATVVVLLTIVMTIVLIRTLGQASRGTINPSEVLLIMGVTVLGQLSTVLSLCLFIAVVATISRLYRDSEMVIWLGSGLSLLQFIRPITRFAWPIWAVIAFLALVAWPWSNQQITELRIRFDQRNDIERVAPGQFQESAGGNRVFFIDKDSPDNRLGKNVFIATRNGQVETITTARVGQIEWQGEDKLLSLQQGQQWLRNIETGEMRLTEFDRYHWLIDPERIEITNASASRELSSLQLFKDPNPSNLAELCWRLGQWLCAINLSFWALAIAAVNPRKGQSHHLMLALLSFMVYFNFINVGLSTIGNGLWPWSTFFLLLHGGAASIVIFWLVGRPALWRGWQRLRQGAPSVKVTA